MDIDATSGKEFYHYTVSKKCKNAFQKKMVKENNSNGIMFTSS